MYSIKSKIWLEKNKELVFGDGKYDLLKTIGKEGSIVKAASRMGITYRKAWSYITAIEKRLDIKLVQRVKGGAYGGGTTLTSQGKEFLEKYEKFRQGINEYVDKKFRKVFHKGEAR